MSKVKLDYKAIDIDAIENFISLLDDAVSFLGRNSVPNDFSMRNTIYNVVSDLRKQRTKLNEIRIWLINSNKNYDSLIDRLNSQALKLPSYQIKSRTKII